MTTTTTDREARFEALGALLVAEQKIEAAQRALKVAKEILSPEEDDE